jgi:hypothetical protein
MPQTPDDIEPENLALQALLRAMFAERWRLPLRVDVVPRYEGQPVHFAGFLAGRYSTEGTGACGRVSIGAMDPRRPAAIVVGMPYCATADGASAAYGDVMAATEGEPGHAVLTLFLDTASWWTPESAPRKAMFGWTATTPPDLLGRMHHRSPGLGRLFMSPLRRFAPDTEH